MNKAHRRALSALGLLALGAAAVVQASSAQGVTLKYGWTKGESFQYRATQQANVTMSNMPGMGEMTISTTAVQLQTFSVDEVAADGAATIRVKFDAVKMDMATPMGSMTYDSAAPPAAPTDPMTDIMAKSLGSIVGQSVTLVVGTNGELRKVDGLATLAQKMNAGMAGASGGLPGVGSIMSEDSLRSMFEQSFIALPNNPIRTGDTWNRVSSVKMAVGTVDTAMTFTLKGIAADAGQQLATLGVAATNRVTMDPKAATNLPMKMTMGAGTITGDIVLDARTARIQRSTLHTTQPMSMDMTGPNGSVSMDAVTKTTVTVELVKK